MKSNFCLRVNDCSTALDTTYVILIRGSKSEVTLPELKYHDPLIQWTSHVYEVKFAALAAIVTKQWMEAKGKERKGKHYGFSGKMSEFCLFFDRGTGCFDIIQMILAGRKAYKNSESYKSCPHGSLLHVWSHNSRTKALLSKIVEQDQGRLYLDEIKERCGNWPSFIRRNLLMNEDCVQNLIDAHGLHRPENLPTSFKHPTMGICHTLLPTPNQAGILAPQSSNGCLVRKNNDRAHLQVSRKGHVARCIDNATMEELVQAHSLPQQPKCDLTTMVHVGQSCCRLIFSKLRERFMRAVRFVALEL